MLTACRPQALQDGKSVLIMIRATGVNPAQFTGNPWGGAGIGSMMLFAAEGLYQFSRMTDKISPRIAASIRHDGNRTIVTLREAMWNDGAPVTAKDVWAFYQMHDAGVLFYLTDLNILDDRTLEYVWREPAPYEQFRMCLIAVDKQLSLPYHIYGQWVDRAAAIRALAPPLSPEKIAAGKRGPFSRDTSATEYQQQWVANWQDFRKAEPPDRMPVMCGPYNFARLNENQMLLKKNERFWAADQIKFDYVKLVSATPEQSVALMKNSRVANMDGSLPLDIAQAVIRKNRDAVFFPIVDPACHGFYINQQSKNAPLDRKEFRQALNYLVRKTPLREAGNYYGQEFDYATTAVPPGFVEKHVSLEVVARMRQYRYDPDKAAALLEQIGCRKVNGWWTDPNGKTIRLAVGVNGGWIPAGVVANVATLFADQLKAFGLMAEVIVADGTIFWERMRSGDFDLTYDWIDVAWSFTYPYYPLQIFYAGNSWRDAMKVPQDPDTGNPLWDVVDWNGEKVDPYQVIRDLPFMVDEQERQYWTDRLVWIANEYAFGITLFQNVTGAWYNRAMVGNLPQEDRIDEFNQMMPIPVDGENLQKTADLVGFGGNSFLFWIEPQ